MGNNSSVQAINTGEGVEKREPSYTVGENVNLHNHYEVPFHASQNGCDPKVYKQ